jgi:peroxiredoxin
MSLIGARLPEHPLFKGRCIVICYPFTGRPGHPNPPDWDHIKGAHGSTPQLLAFSDRYDKFQAHDFNCVGLSFMTTEWQSDFMARNKLRFPLLSDHDRTISSSLGLTTFKAGNVGYLTRRTLVSVDGIIRHDILPLASPENNAEDVLALLG